jgi:AbrB family looped-hinge helix DNA binding protein
MQTQTVFKAGNSPFAVTIPKNLAKEINLKQGEKVIIDKMDDNSIIIRRAKITKKNKTRAKADFEKWLKRFINENGEALDELAVR